MSYVMVGAAAAGLLKSQLVDRPAAERQRRLRAEEIRLSPWTKMGPTTDVKEADPMGSALSFGITGNQISNGLAQQELNKKLAEKALNQTYTPVTMNTGPSMMAPNYWGAMYNAPLGTGYGG